ncbi:hypothetical protein F2Q68_00025604 [Brassica cretica]|uniref:Secreted protein n=1 Tax=Brassica cretica TaxID=69181 RepID=A0A8S9IKD8_BRACR|nr:hypothetical protein F2Q68_00025604 [Brassica cretica]
MGGLVGVLAGLIVVLGRRVSGCLERPAAAALARRTPGGLRGMAGRSQRSWASGMNRSLSTFELLDCVDGCFVITRPRVAVLYGGASFVESPLRPPLTSLCVYV